MSEIQEVLRSHESNMLRPLCTFPATSSGEESSAVLETNEESRNRSVCDHISHMRGTLDWYAYNANKPHLITHTLTRTQTRARTHTLEETQGSVYCLKTLGY